MDRSEKVGRHGVDEHAAVQAREAIVGNSLLESLPPADLELLNPRAVSLAAGQLLPCGSGAPVLFPVDCLISTLCGEGPHSLETALVGREGMIGPGLTHRRSAAFTGAAVRVAGSALCVSADTMRQGMSRSPALRNALHGHGALCLEQAEYAIVAASRCTVEQRLSRWLLMAHNRLERDEFGITHDVLASALGVRRPGVTVALHMLEGLHAIQSRRGLVTIRCRDQLKRCAAFAYHDVFYPRPAPAETGPCGPADLEVLHGLGHGRMPSRPPAGTAVPVLAAVAKHR